MRKPVQALAVAAATGTLFLGAWSATPAGAAHKSSKSSTKAPIKIALIDSTTGVAGPQYVKAPSGFLARIAEQNAKGGVHGHKIDPIVINDAGHFTAETSIMQSAVETKGAFGIVGVTPFMFAGYRWLQQNHIPVTGATSDGPEWFEPQNTNMFGSDTGGGTANFAAQTTTYKLFKMIGGKKASIASLGYGVSPSSSQAAKNDAIAAKYAGLSAPYLNTSVTFGSTNFTSEALQIKQSGANIVVPAMDGNSNFALIQDLKNAGAKVTGALVTGLEPTVVGSPSWTALQGSYFYQVWVPAQLHTKATKNFQSALKKYEHIPTKTFPDWAQYESWLGADLMIKGLELDGPNPTRAGVIAKLRKLKKYTGGGLIPKPIDYQTIQHHAGPSCLYVLKAVKSGFTPLKKPICGSKIIPGTGTSS